MKLSKNVTIEFWESFSRGWICSKMHGHGDVATFFSWMDVVVLSLVCWLLCCSVGSCSHPKLSKTFSATHGCWLETQKPSFWRLKKSFIFLFVVVILNNFTRQYLCLNGWTENTVCEKAQDGDFQAAVSKVKSVELGWKQICVRFSQVSWNYCLNSWEYSCPDWSKHLHGVKSESSSENTERNFNLFQTSATRHILNFTPRGKLHPQGWSCPPGVIFVHGGEVIPWG
jgi:hypothetical protein